MRTVCTRAAAAVLFTLGVAGHAAAQQSNFTLNIGYFALKGADSRVVGDTLNVDLGVDPDTSNSLPLFFEIKDFNSGLINGEYYVGIGDFVEVGAGLGFYQRTVPSVYAEFTGPGQVEIQQDLKLRVAPVTFAAKFFPLGNQSPVQPYVGGGVGVFMWRYSEVGEFLDDNLNIFSNRYVAKDVDVGPVVMGGVRFPVGDHFMTGGEIRWQKAEGTLPTDKFLGPKIDLGGYTFSWLLAFK